MKRNHVSLGKIRRLLVSLFALAILASAFLATPLSALADNPPVDPCKVHADKVYYLETHGGDPSQIAMHQQMYCACVGGC